MGAIYVLDHLFMIQQNYNKYLKKFYIRIILSHLKVLFSFVLLCTATVADDVRHGIIMQEL